VSRLPLNFAIGVALAGFACCAWMAWHNPQPVKPWAWPYFATPAAITLIPLRQRSQRWRYILAAVLLVVYVLIPYSVVVMFFYPTAFLMVLAACDDFGARDHRPE